jgi:RNA polymerase sigma factor (sigma-70 family)
VSRDVRKCSEGPGGVKATVLRSALRLQDDDHLVELHRAGAAPAFEVVVERYHLPLTRFCTRLLGRDHAEDAVQETFTAAYTALRKDERPVQLKAWLYRIAHNASITTLRRKGSTYEELDENFDGVRQPPEHFERRQQLKSIIEEISALPERQRTAIVRRAFEGRTLREIAAELDVDVPVVRQLVYRARERLRKTVGCAGSASVVAQTL